MDSSDITRQSRNKAASQIQTFPMSEIRDARQNILKERLTLNHAVALGGVAYSGPIRATFQAFGHGTHRRSPKSTGLAAAAAKGALGSCRPAAQGHPSCSSPAAGRLPGGLHPLAAL